MLSSSCKSSETNSDLSGSAIRTLFDSLVCDRRASSVLRDILPRLIPGEASADEDCLRVANGVDADVELAVPGLSIPLNGNFFNKYFPTCLSIRIHYMA